MSEDLGGWFAAPGTRAHWLRRADAQTALCGVGTTSLPVWDQHRGPWEPADADTRRCRRCKLVAMARGGISMREGLNEP